jgi:hypothetical protein
MWFFYRALLAFLVSCVLVSGSRPLSACPSSWTVGSMEQLDPRSLCVLFGTFSSFLLSHISLISNNQSSVALFNLPSRPSLGTA